MLVAREHSTKIDQSIGSTIVWLNRRCDMPDLVRMSSGIAECIGLGRDLT